MDKHLEKNKKAEKWFIWGILFICLTGTLFHFLFDIFNESVLVGLISPINESVWEHFKIIYFSTIIWFVILYFKLGKNNKLIIAAAISILVSTLAVLTIYYIYIGAFGNHSLVVDIVSFVLGVSLGQYIALVIYLRLDYKRKYLIAALVYLGVFLFLLILFTFVPPRIPLFYDKSNNQYGIK